MFDIEQDMKNKVEVQLKKQSERREETIKLILQELDKTHEKMNLKSSERDRKLVEAFSRLAFDAGFNHGGEKPRFGSIHMLNQLK